MELVNELKTLYIDTADKLKGRDRRLFMARVAGALGPTTANTIPLSVSGGCWSNTGMGVCSIV